MVALLGSPSRLGRLSSRPPRVSASRPVVTVLRVYSVVLGTTGALVVAVITDLRLLSAMVALFALMTWLAYRILRRQGPLPISAKLVTAVLVVAVVGLVVASRADTLGPLWIVPVIPVVLAPAAIGWLVRSVRDASAVIDQTTAELAAADAPVAAPRARHTTRGAAA